MSKGPLTKEERLEYLEIANARRHERHLIRQKLAAGELSIREVFADDNIIVARLKVYSLLCCIPQVWKNTAESAFNDLGISSVDEMKKVRVENLSTQQREQLATYLETHPARTNLHRGDEIVAYLKTHPEATPNEIVDALNVSRRTANLWIERFRNNSI